MIEKPSGLGFETEKFEEHSSPKTQHNHPDDSDNIIYLGRAAALHLLASDISSISAVLARLLRAAAYQFAESRNSSANGSKTWRVSKEETLQLPFNGIVKSQGTSSDNHKIKVKTRSCLREYVVPYGLGQQLP